MYGHLCKEPHVVPLTSTLQLSALDRGHFGYFQLPITVIMSHNNSEANSEAQRRCYSNANHEQAWTITSKLEGLHWPLYHLRTMIPLGGTKIR